MSDVFVTQTGNGDQSGVDLNNAIAIGSLTGTHWNTPAHSADGAERIWFYGAFSTQVQVAGVGGTDADNLLWVDMSNAAFAVEWSYTVSTNGKSYLRVILGAMVSTASTTSAVVDLFRAHNSVKVSGESILNHHADACLRSWCDLTTDNDNIEIEGLVAANTDINTINAITFAHSGTAGHTSKYSNCTVRKCNIRGGKIVVLYNSAAQQIGVDNRRGVGWDIDENTITQTPANAIQLTYSDVSPVSRVRRNYLRDIGSESTLTNAIQTNNSLGLIIEENDIHNVINGVGPIGDGNGIIVDWSAELGRPYSDGVIVRNNRISGCNSVPQCSGISIWAGINTVVYGNRCTENSNGISVSDAVALQSWTTTGITAGVDTTFNYTNASGNEIFVGDEVVIAGTSGFTPDIDGTHTVKTASPGTFTIELSTTGTWNSDGGISRVHRGFGNKINNNGCTDNTDAGVLVKSGGQAIEIVNNILGGNQRGYYHKDVNGSVYSPETNNVFFNNSVENILDGITPVAVDATSFDLSYSPLDDDIRPWPGESWLFGGLMWWGSDPDPIDGKGEPFSPTQTPIGPWAIDYHPDHPINLAKGF